MTGVRLLCYDFLNPNNVSLKPIPRNTNLNANVGMSTDAYFTIYILKQRSNSPVSSFTVILDYLPQLRQFPQGLNLVLLASVNLTHCCLIQFLSFINWQIYFEFKSCWVEINICIQILKVHFASNIAKPDLILIVTGWKCAWKSVNNISEDVIFSVLGSIILMGG